MANCSNNRKSSFEHDVFTMVSLTDCLSVAISSQRNELYTVNPVIYAVILFLQIMRVVVRAHK